MGANAKLTYSALIRKSSKNHYINSNHSFSSGIYVDVLPDLSKRPLVVSFKKHKAQSNINGHSAVSGGGRDMCDMRHEHCYRNDFELEYIVKDRSDSVEETFCESEFATGPSYDSNNMAALHSSLRKSQEERPLRAVSEDVDVQRQKKLSKIRNLFRQCKTRGGESHSCSHSGEVPERGEESVRKSSSVPCFADKS